MRGSAVPCSGAVREPAGTGCVRCEAAPASLTEGPGHIHPVPRHITFRKQALYGLFVLFFVLSRSVSLFIVNVAVLKNIAPVTLSNLLLFYDIYRNVLKLFKINTLRMKCKIKCYIIGLRHS